MEKVRATRQNGRSGKEGVFKAGHNDRSFDLKKAEHIDSDKSICNVYWDFIQGLNIADENGIRPERKYNFDDIELAFYASQFGDSIDAQNDRHRKARHAERVRGVEEIVEDPKICPEETVYQLGTKDAHADPLLFAQVVTELIQEVEKRYGSNFKILDWALHMDEATPHIHERHVFFAKDDYGLLFPKQDRACQELGFEVPDPNKKSGKYNSRKMSFDAEIRRLYIEIAERYGVTIEKVPLKGREHLEKNDYIIARQEEVKAANAIYIAEQELKIADIDAIANEVAEKAYEKACEVVTETVKEETIKADIGIVNDYQEWFTSPDHKATDDHKNIVRNVLDVIIKRLARNKTILLEKVRGILAKPEIKKKNKEDIAHVARESVLEILERNKKKAAEHNASRQIPTKDISRDWGER